MVKLYVLEDEHMMSDILADFFKSRNFEVKSSREGIGASDLILQFAPDLLMLDQLLPGKTGLEVLAELRTKGFSSPVILLTNNPVESFDEAELEKLGVVASYTKTGITLPTLTDVILQHTPAGDDPHSHQ